MKPNALLPQLVIALLLAGLAAINTALFQHFSGGLTGARLNLSLIVLVYLGWLIIRHNRMPAGRVTLMATDIGMVVLCLLLEARLSTLFWLYPAMIWLNRSLLRYSGILAVLADSALCLIGAGAALLALGNGYGMIMAIWCFLLLQALHVMIPCRKGCNKTESTATAKDDFNLALQSAENALQQLMKKA